MMVSAAGVREVDLGALPFPLDSRMYPILRARGKACRSSRPRRSAACREGTNSSRCCSPRDHGKPYDAAAFDRLAQAAVDEAVAQQEIAGVSIVSDGELGKVGYST
jgi:hypothetical protein